MNMSLLSELKLLCPSGVARPPGMEHVSDFGGYRCTVPTVVLSPENIHQVQDVVEFAARHSVPISVRGHGCSSGGQSLTRGILIETRHLNNLQIERESIICGGGSKWGDIQNILVRREQTVPVLINRHDTTVGGTLSVGGFGGTSLRRGPQAAHVEELSILSRQGKLIQAKKGDPIFAFALCGLGRVGVILEAKIPLIPYLQWTKIEHRWFSETFSLLEIAKMVAAESDWDHCKIIFSLNTRQWKLVLGSDHHERPVELASNQELHQNYYRYCFEKEAAFVSVYARSHFDRCRIPRPSSTAQIWADYLLPAESADTFFAEVRSRLSDGTCLRNCHGTVLCGQQGLRDLLPLAPVPRSSLIVTIGTYTVVPKYASFDYLARFDYLAEFCLSLGGAVYLHGAHPRDNAFFERQFGSDVIRRWHNLQI